MRLPGDNTSVTLQYIDTGVSGQLLLKSPGGRGTGTGFQVKCTTPRINHRGGSIYFIFLAIVISYSWLWQVFGYSLDLY